MTAPEQPKTHTLDDLLTMERNRAMLLQRELAAANETIKFWKGQVNDEISRQLLRGQVRASFDRIYSVIRAWVFLGHDPKKETFESFCQFVNENLRNFGQVERPFMRCAEIMAEWGFQPLPEQLKELEQFDLRYSQKVAPIFPFPAPAAEVQPQVTPKTFFLNERHEEHIPASQVRKEKRERLKKRKNKVKLLLQFPDDKDIYSLDAEWNWRKGGTLELGDLHNGGGYLADHLTHAVVVRALTYNGPHGAVMQYPKNLSKHAVPKMLISKKDAEKLIAESIPLSDAAAPYLKHLNKEK